MRGAFTVAVALYAAQACAAPTCSWDRPGANPYTGDVPAAVAAYSDIPAPVREKLRARMQRIEYDELVEIRRDSITGKAGRYGNLREMHFGGGGFCPSVTRAKWSADHVERGLVYCEDGYCLIVPTVCRNVSRIDALWSPAATEPRDALDSRPWVLGEQEPANRVPEPPALWLWAAVICAWVAVRGRRAFNDRH